MTNLVRTYEALTKLTYDTRTERVKPVKFLRPYKGRF